MSAVRLRDLVGQATAMLAEADVPSPRADAVALAGHVLDWDRGQIEAGIVLGADVGDVEQEQFALAVDRRRARVPLQHILGLAPFRYLDLIVGPGVFVPRPETESVAQAVIDEATAVVARGGRPVVVDLCAGSAAIAVAVATEVPQARVIAVESSDAAGYYAAKNIDRYGGAVQLLIDDVRSPELLADLDASVDVVVANPPYLPPGARPIDVEVALHDPDLALYGGGADGLDVPRVVTAVAGRLLRPGGLFVMEHANVQGAAVRAVVAEASVFVNIHTDVDMAGRDRMVCARRQGSDPIPAADEISAQAAPIAVAPLSMEDSTP